MFLLNLIFYLFFFLILVYLFNLFFFFSVKDTFSWHLDVHTILLWRLAAIFGIITVKSILILTHLMKKTCKKPNHIQIPFPFLRCSLHLPPYYSIPLDWPSKRWTSPSFSLRWQFLRLSPSSWYLNTRCWGWIRFWRYL